MRHSVYLGSTKRKIAKYYRWSCNKKALTFCPPKLSLPSTYFFVGSSIVMVSYLYGRSFVSLVGSFLLEDQNSATLSSGEVTRLCTEGTF
jgi:hypothetical protein